MKDFDPIHVFIEKIGIDISLIKDFIIGEKYAAVILKNGNIGLAANIFNVVNFDFRTVKIFDIGNFTHRLFLLAFFNARLNSFPEEILTGDIFDLIDFTRYKNIVMIGYSVPMYTKLKKINCLPFVFDNHSDKEFILKQDLMPNYLRQANALILTGTSIINNTFKDIIRQVNKSCDVFLIGPSVSLSDILIKSSVVKAVFGTQFKINDNSVIRLISQNKGTDCLKKYGKKVAITGI